MRSASMLTLVVAGMSGALSASAAESSEPHEVTLVRAAVIRCLEDGRGHGGHILTASNAITDRVPMENYLAAVNAYRDYSCLDRIAF